jgi:hypothetical protein
MKKKKAAIITALLAIVYILWTTPLVSANKDSAQSMYENALKSSGLLFERFQILDKTGQDTSEVKQMINGILDKLTDAQIAFNNEDYERSLIISRQVQELSVEATSQVESLLTETTSPLDNIDLRFAFTLIEAAIISIIAFFFWGFLKQNYIKNILKKRPVTVQHEH